MTITVVIPKWDKFNPRSDRANYTWFRLQNDFMTHHSLFSLSDSDKLLFILLLCEASKENKPELVVSVDYISAIRKTTPDKIAKQLEILSSVGLIELGVRGEEPANSRQIAGKEPALLPATDERTNVTNNSQLSADFSPEAFQNLWNQTRGTLPGCERLTGKRRKALVARLAEAPEREYWEKLIKFLAADDFYSGKNDRGWKASFDFLLQPDRHVKLSEQMNSRKPKTELRPKEFHEL